MALRCRERAPSTTSKADSCTAAIDLISSAVPSRRSCHMPLLADGNPRCRHFFELNSPHRPRLSRSSGSRGCCMSVADDVSYLSRFLVKFVEIIAAGLATAVSAYLIAHFTGALSSPAPAPTAAAIQVAPSASMQSNLPEQPISPTSADINERRVPPPQDVNAPPVASPA